MGFGASVCPALGAGIVCCSGAPGVDGGGGVPGRAGGVLASPWWSTTRPRGPRGPSCRWAVLNLRYVAASVQAAGNFFGCWCSRGSCSWAWSACRRRHRDVDGQAGGEVELGRWTVPGARWVRGARRSRRSHGHRHGRGQGRPRRAAGADHGDARRAQGGEGASATPRGSRRPEVEGARRRPVWPAPHHHRRKLGQLADPA